MSTYDLDAMVSQRAEAVGGERVEFTYGGETFSFPHPLFADDEFKDGLADVQTDMEMAEHYLGDQYDKFIEVGGKSGFIGILLQKVQEDATDVDEKGNPTLSRRSSNRAQRRQKRR
ncbi:hypothetical protein [Tomitella gaofuii]|uniref:hypothetical protein n=1 Tax=Tomitella gaofuii TaxID=2760083 RepID=UPI0015FD914B|nr:hypothetical protein [Tomitella gaofuii]